MMTMRLCGSSPDNNKLAVIGCYWACPYVSRIYDISRPDQYPFPLLFESDENMGLKWISNHKLEIKNRNGETVSVAV